MNILESAFEQVSDDIEAGRLKQYDYDLKIEIPLKEGVETVHGKALLTKTMSTLQSASHDGDIIEFYDIENTHIAPTLSGVKATEIGSRFCIETTKGKNKTILFGLNIKTTVPFSIIKDRVIDQLNDNKTYIRIHYGGFEHGVNWINLGFLLDVHPTTSYKPSVLKEISDKIVQSWNADDGFWTPDKQHEIKMLVDPSSTTFTPAKIPMTATSVHLVSRLGDKMKKTTVTMITTPQKFQNPSTQCMDCLLLISKNIDGYIPMGYKYENPEAFHAIITQHSEWMENHRNIQVQYTDAYKNAVLTGNDGMTLQQILKSRTDIMAIYHDSSNNRYNISVVQEKYRDVIQKIHDDIRDQQFPFDIQVKMPKPSGTSISTNTTATTRYQHALASIATKATTRTKQKENYTATTPFAGNVWRRHKEIPIIIDFTNDDDQFPPLSPRHTQTSPPSQTSEYSNTTITMTTIQTAVSEALKKVTEAHKTEICLLRNEIKSLKDTFQVMVDTVASQAKIINQHIIAISKPIDKTSPPRKRRPTHFRTPTKSNRTSSKMECEETELNDEDSIPERWDSDSDDEATSSHTDVTTSGGRED